MSVSKYQCICTYIYICIYIHVGILKNAKKTLTDYKQEGNDLRITVQNGASKIPSFVNKLTENNIEIDAVSASKPTLDDVFLKVTGYRLEGSETSTKSEQPIKES